MKEQKYQLAHQVCVENDKLILCICSLYAHHEDENGSKAEDKQEQIILHYVRGNYHQGSRGPDFIIVARGGALKHVKKGLPEAEIAAITFEGVYEEGSGKRKKYSLVYATPVGKPGGTDKYRADEIEMEITKKLSDMVSVLTKYANEVSDIDDDGKYFLTEKAIGYWSKNGSFSTNGADPDTSTDLQDLDCLPFRGSI